ncbi:MAG: PIG-L family deacetylase, partial [Deltaproteobacteria bacterium]|nr:PIG-L family deacetylase [Deltaproteobacteria bacterium]
MKALALHHQPPRSDLRVLVGGDLDDAAIEPYLAVRSRVTRTPTGGNPDRREHARLPADTSGLPTHRAGDADLVLLTTSPAISMDVVVTAVAAALAPGGLAVLAVPGPAARSLLGSIAAHGLMLREHERSSGDTSSTEVLVLADARAVVPLPLGGLELDRSACVDREQIHRLAARGRWRGPRPSQGPSSIDPLLDALHRQLTTGEIDIWRLPWPSASPSSTSKDSGCDVLAVMPHPDDESVYAGGTLAGLVAAGQRVKLVVATDGAGGRGGSDLGRRRAHELWLASHALGLDGVRCLAWSDFGKYRDGSRTAPVTAADALRTWGLDVALADVVAEIRRARPRRLLGLGPEVDPNFSLHGHHLGLGVVLAVAFHAAADERFAPQLGPAWACAEHRVMAPLAHASAADAFEVPRAAKIRALRAHTS